MHAVSRQLLEERKARLEKVFHVVLKRSILFAMQIGYRMLTLRATKKHGDRAWVADQEFLTHELPRGGNGGRRTCHLEIINIHE